MFEEDAVNRKHGVVLTREEAREALEGLHEMKVVSAYAEAEFEPELTAKDKYGEI